ncbi:hypothetical protein QBB34_46085 [Streptomyces stelliscabiei]|uniref:hypothetical protein n=1 Tax=Streptomyces stelliscabiei TaxID=146820 RepID=UPI002FF378B9
MRVLVDVHHVVTGAQPFENAPLPQQVEVFGGALPAQDRPSAQLVHFVVRPGVGQHAVGAVLDADDAVGESRHRLGQGEQLRRLAGVRHRRHPRVVDNASGHGVELSPANLRTHTERGDAGLGGDPLEVVQIIGVVDLDSHRGSALARRGADEAECSAATEADDQYECSRAGRRLVVGIHDHHVLDADIEPGGGGDHTDHRFAECQQELPHVCAAGSACLPHGHHPTQTESSARGECEQSL